jgi:cytochrome c oxidase cbb3-type subunit III
MTVCRRSHRALSMALLLAAAGAVAPSAARPSAQEPQSVPRLKPISMNGDAAKGERVYLERCWPCHGLAGDGKGPAAAGMSPPPSDFTLPDALREKSDSMLLDAILKGKPGGAMYPQGVDPQSAVDLVAFLKTLPRVIGREKNFLDSLARADKEAGRALYNRRCWPCHGPTGRGNGPAATALRPPPADLGDPDKVAERTAARLYAALSRGVPGTAMAAQDISDKEKFDLIAYLRTMVHYGEEEKTRDDTLPKGDAAKGKENYDKRCWACHGSAGGGDGPAAADMIPAPTRFSDYDSMKGRSDQDWFNAVRSGIPGTAMYPQRLTDSEILDLIPYLRSLGRRKMEAPPAR